MSSDELQTSAITVKGTHHADIPPDVTIKFFRSDLQLQAHKHALIAGSAFFADHFLRHPSSTKAKAPKDIQPGVNISFETVQIAINYLHGVDIPEDSSVAKNSVSLLLAARAFGIPGLEESVKTLLARKLDYQVGRVAGEVQIIELVGALRELYGVVLGGGGGGEVGKAVAGVVAGVVAGACCKRIAMLKRSPEFIGLLREVPVLAVDILAADVEVGIVDEVVVKVVEGVVEEVVEELVEEELVEEVVEEEITGEIVAEDEE